MSEPLEPDLDQLLTTWAQDERLDAAESRAILDAIAAEPRDLPATWWTDMGLRVGDAMTDAAAASSATFVTMGWVPRPLAA